MKSRLFLGDLMVADDEGFITFVDRIGDTFRWKGSLITCGHLFSLELDRVLLWRPLFSLRYLGENVSTTEVENAIINCLPNCDVAVFGVHIPGFPGKAGMACVTGSHGLSESRSIAVLNDALKEALPSYARPLFLRIMQDIEVTG